MDWQPTLTGKLLNLRPVMASDWDALSLVGCDPEVWAGHPAYDRYMVDKFRAYFEDGLKSGGALIAVDAQSDQVMGWSRYSAQFVEPDEIEIGWTFLGRHWWGGAYNAEKKRLMIQHAFGLVDRVLFRIAESNIRSRRAAEKIGATLLTDRIPPVEPGASKHLFYQIEKCA
jgi:RimJ/RimL family protein N-acetyltransferase